MVSPETTTASPRISFSADFLDDESFISISPSSSFDNDEIERDPKDHQFEFLSTKNSIDGTESNMLTADELFFEGKLLPYWQMHHAADKLNNVNLKSQTDAAAAANGKDHPQQVSRIGNGILLGREQQEPRIWFVDDDPSPRPPKCTVLWKELLRLKKHRNSTLSPSSSSSSSSSLGDAAAAASVEEREKDQKEMSSREKHIKRIKKGLERTRSASIRIRPMVNVPICQTGKSSSLPPLFPLKKNNKLDR